MTTLTDISASANRRMVAAQIHHAERPGAGQAAAFAAEIDSIVTLHKTKMDNLNASDGTSVTTAKTALDDLATLVKAAPIDAPSAA